MEINASFAKGAVVFAGETIELQIEFRNLSETERSTLAWGSAQVICQCTVHRAKVVLPSAGSMARLQPSNDVEHAFSPMKGEKGRTVWETDTTILFCDLTLDPLASKTYTFSATIGTNAIETPPSYRGSAVNYSYKVIIGTQKVGVRSTAELLKMPFRVFPVTELLASARRRETGFSVLHSDSTTSLQTDISFAETIASTEFSRESIVRLRLGSVEDAEDSICDDSITDDFSHAFVHRESALLSVAAGGVEAALINPFIEQPKINIHARQRTLHGIGSLTLRKRPKVYNIGTTEKCVGKLFISKMRHRIGEDVVGWFDFADSTVPCYQISIVLECCEKLSSAYRNPAMPKGKGKAVAATEVAKRHIFTANLATAPFMLPIPLTCSPDFATEIVQVEWRLSFEFILHSSAPQVKQTASDIITTEEGVKTYAPHKVNVEAIQWSLPINVYPTNPATVPFKNVTQSLRL